MRTAAGVVKVLDFGIARMESLTSARLTQDGDVIGTPGYMAPEQIRGEEPDFRADLFSLGVLLYEVASGSNPFEAGTRTATLARVLEVDPVPLSQLSPGTLPRLDRIVSTCLSKQPSGRYDSTDQLVADLELLQAEMSAARRHEPAPTRDRASTPRWWWEFHQAAASIVYVLMMYPAWRVRAWLPPPLGTLFLLAALACAAAATTLRLHLLFVSRLSPAELVVERDRTKPWTRWCDAGLTGSLAAAALGIGSAHPAIAMLLVTVAVAAAVAAFKIEPATARAAFRSASADRQSIRVTAP